MKTAAARARLGAPDPFGARAPKLAALLGAPREGRVLAAGEALAGWEEDLAAYFAHAELHRRLDEPSLHGPYDLVLWAPPPPECGAGFARTLAAVRRALSPSGTLLLLARNLLSLRALAHGAPGLAGSGARTGRGYRRALATAGFGSVRAFLALPSLEQTEEFAAPGAPRTFSPGAGLAERALAAAGLLPAVHDGFAFVASGPGGGLAPLLDALAGALPGAGPYPPVLERFALRERGALVLRLRTDAGGFVCRAAAAGEAARTIGLNAEWTRRLRASAALSPWLRARVPAPAAERALGDVSLFAETAVDGVIGWTLAVARRAALAEDLARFATELHRGSAASRPLDAAALDRLLPPLLPPHAAALQRAYAGVRAALLHRLAGEERVLAWAHGDYGPGNAIADARTGRLAGVIDWDGAGDDLAGVDLLNAAAQRRHLEAREPAERAFAEVAAAFATEGFRALGAAEMDALLPLDAARRAELSAWTALRIVLRGARYPRPFAAGREGLGTLLATAGELLVRSEEAP